MHFLIWRLVFSNVSKADIGNRKQTEVVVVAGKV